MSPLFCVGVIAITLAFASACGPAPASVDAASGSVAEHVASAPCEPLKVGALFDVTTSMTASRITPPAVADFEPLLKRIERCGGEIGVGLIDEKPGAPLLRYRADPAPTPPQIKAEGNVISAAIDRNNQMAAYEERRKAWEQDQGRQASMADFRSGLEPILARRLDAQFSPVWISVQRMAVFMAEPGGFNGLTPKKYCLWVTDGEDTTTAGPATLPPDMKGIAVVNGSGSVGVLGVFHPARFESLSAAVSWVLQQEEQK
jgi:hypothetical protein